MSEFDAILAVGASTVLLLGVVSGYIRNRLWISEPASRLAVGVGLSPLEFELLGVAPGSDQYLTLVQQVARVTLAISVMGAALRRPRSTGRAGIPPPGLLRSAPAAAPRLLAA